MSRYPPSRSGWSALSWEVEYRCARGCVVRCPSWHVGTPSSNPRNEKCEWKKRKEKKGKNKRKGNEKLDDRIGTRRNFCLSPTASPTLPIASLAILLARICNKGRQSREIRLIACSRDREPLPEGLLIAYLRLQSLVWPHKTPGVVSRTVEWIVDGEKYKK